MDDALKRLILLFTWNLRDFFKQVKIDGQQKRCKTNEMKWSKISWYLYEIVTSISRTSLTPTRGIEYENYFKYIQ